MSPEMLNRSGYTSKVDMWALGIILYKLLSESKHPFYRDDLQCLSISAICNEEEPNPLPSSVSPFMKEMVARLLDKNPETRPDALTLLQIQEIWQEAI